MWTHRLETAASAKDRLNALSRRGYAYHSSGNKDAALADYEAAIETSRSVHIAILFSVAVLIGS